MKSRRTLSMQANSVYGWGTDYDTGLATRERMLD
jgi:hypothetical protein